MVALSEGMSQRLAKLEYCLAASLVEFATSLAEVMLFLAAMPAVWEALFYMMQAWQLPRAFMMRLASLLCCQFPRASAELVVNANARRLEYSSSRSGDEKWNISQNNKSVFSFCHICLY